MRDDVSPPSLQFEIKLVSISLSWIPKKQAIKENTCANSIARPDDVNNFVQTRLAGEFLSIYAAIMHKVYCSLYDLPPSMKALS